LNRPISEQHRVFPVERVVQFLRNADDCLAQADQAQNSAIREQLEKLATSWTDLAFEREQFLKSKLPQGH
jgi:hypothetical protein